MREIVGVVISGFLYSAIIVGIFMMFGEDFNAYAAKIRIRHRLKAAKKRHKEASAFEIHLEQMIQITLNLKLKAKYFIWLCGIICFSITVIGMRSMAAGTALFMGAIIAGLPYLVLRIKLENIRRKSSFEGETFVGNFLSAYRIANFNIYKAMEQIGKEKNKAKNCTDLISKMLFELRATADPLEIKRISDKFAYAINTNWSRMLAYNIGLAASDGTNVSIALEDILIQLREAKALAEERRRLNSEATRMVVFLIPVLYVATIFMSVRYIGIPLRTFIRNQLFTSQGFMMLLLALFLFLVNIIFIEIVNNQKFDY